MAVNATTPSETGTDDRHRAGTAPRGYDVGNFDRILLAVDGDTDYGVVETAVSLAARHGAEVDALSIVRMNASVDHWDVVVERREAEAESALDGVEVAAAAAEVPVEKRLRYGSRAEEIVQYARHNDVDLIVVGEPNRTGIRRLLRPKSVTDRVRHAASVPVLAVPAGESEVASAPAGTASTASSGDAD